MSICADLTQRFQIGDSHSWASAGMAGLTLKPFKHFIREKFSGVRKIISEKLRDSILFKVKYFYGKV